MAIEFWVVQFGLKSQLYIVPLYIEPVAGLSKSETRNAFTSHFENMSTSCQCDVIASCDWLFCFTVFVNKSHS